MKRNFTAVEGHAPSFKRPKLGLTHTFTVAVGSAPNSKTYTLPSESFADRSGFFKDALSSQRGVGEVPIDLRDVHTLCFDSYVHAVCYGQVNIVNHGQRTNMHESVELYFLANRLMDVRTSNLAITHLIERSKASGLCPSPTALFDWYERSSSLSSLRRLVVDWTVQELSWSLQDLDGDCNEDDQVPLLAPGLVAEAMHRFGHLRKEYPLERVQDAVSLIVAHRSQCHYHQHDEAHPTCTPY